MSCSRPMKQDTRRGGGGLHGAGKDPGGALRRGEERTRRANKKYIKSAKEQRMFLQNHCLPAIIILYDYVRHFAAS